MKRILFTAVLASFATFASAASIEGKWKTFDEKDGTPKAHIQITKVGNTYQGKVVGVEPTCAICKQKNLVGQTVLTGLQQESSNEYANGKIRDPQSGKTYKAKATVKGGSLEVRGFVGVSLLGRTQVWKRM